MTLTRQSGSLAAPSVVLYDGLLATYRMLHVWLVNAASMHCSIAFTRILRNSDVLVRSALRVLVSHQTDGVADRRSGMFDFNCGSLGFARMLRRRTSDCGPLRSAGGQWRGEESNEYCRSRRQRRWLARDCCDGQTALARTYADCVNAASALLDDKTQTDGRGV